MSRKREDAWRRGEFEIIGRDGQPLRVVGSVRGRFGLFDHTETMEGVTRRVTYLARLVTSQSLAAFATRREARLAAQVVSDMAVDGSDNGAVIDRWQRAGFYVSGDLPDATGNSIWRLLGGQLTAGYTWGALASEGQPAWLH